jgi:pimeloyl-ACP methyl ester carboxylesterase
LASLLSTVPRWCLGSQLDALPAFNRPVVVVAWEGDPVHPMSVAEEIATLAPSARLIRLPSATEGADPAVSFPLLERAMSATSTA